MENNFLLQSQKNEVLMLIRDYGLDPSRFEWSNVYGSSSPPSLVSKINYIDTGFFYIFDINGETHQARFSPADSSYVGTAYPVIWSGQKQCFTEWLKNLIKEENEPDLWKSYPATEKQPVGTVRKNHTYSAKPSGETPEPEEMTEKIEKMFSEGSSTFRNPSPSTGFVIKRYYGKA